MRFVSNIDSSLELRLAPTGGYERHNIKLCWQAHDDYYRCIDSQVEKDSDTGN